MKRPYRKLKVKLIFRSGATVSFITGTIERKVNANQDLIGIILEEGRLPFYNRLSAIDAITVRRCWFRWGWV